METNAEIIQTVLMYVCCAGLIASGVVLFLATVGCKGLDAVRRWLHLDGFGKVVVAFCFCWLWRYAATKQSHVSHPGSDEGITLADITVEYSTNTLQTAAEVKWTDGTVTTATPVHVRMSNTNEWAELSKINPTITTDLPTNVLSFSVSGDVTGYPYWWVGSNPPAVIIETIGIKLTSFLATSSSVSLSWTCDDQKALTFTVQRKLTSDANWQTVGTVEKASAMSFTFQGFTVDKTWAWRIRTEYQEANQ